MSKIPDENRSAQTFTVVERTGKKTMHYPGKKRIIALTVVCHFLLFTIVFFGNTKNLFQGHRWNAEENCSSGLSDDESIQQNTPAWRIRNLCRKRSLRILYFVHTAPGNINKRHWLRNTLGDPTVAFHMNSAIVFFLGEAPELADHVAVLDEALREGDVVVLNFTDTYRNLTYKFLYGAKWVSDNCLLDPTDVIVKLDDDVLVNLPALSAYLTSGLMELTGIHCRVYKGTKPHRTKKSKWYVTEEEYPLSIYPPYCDGPGMIMQPSVLSAIYEASSAVPFFWVDDVYITGLVAGYANVTIVEISRYVIFGWGKTAPRACDMFMFLHKEWNHAARAKMRRIWQRFKEHNRTVDHDFTRNVHVYYRSVP